MLERTIAGALLVGGVLLLATVWQSAYVPHEEAAEEPSSEAPRPRQAGPPAPPLLPAPPLADGVARDVPAEDRDDEDEDEHDEAREERKEKGKGKKRGRGG